MLGAKPSSRSCSIVAGSLPAPRPSTSLASASPADTSGRSMPTGVAAGGSKGDVPLSAVGCTLCLLLSGVQVEDPPNSHHPRMSNHFQGPQLTAVRGALV